MQPCLFRRSRKILLSTILTFITLITSMPELPIGLSEKTDHMLLGRDRRKETSIDVVLIGSAETNYRIAKEAIACAYLGENYPISMTMLGSNASAYENKLRRECPGLYNSYINNKIITVLKCFGNGVVICIFFFVAVNITREIAHIVCFVMLRYSYHF